MSAPLHGVGVYLSVCFAAGLVAASPAAAQESAPPGARAEEPIPWHDDPGARPAQDPKALEILRAGLKAMGGEEAILRRTTIYVKWKIVNHEYPEPREGTITVWFRRPDKLRKEIEYPEMKHIEVYDGEQAWFDSGTGPTLRNRFVTAAIQDGIGELDLPANCLDAELTYFNISQEIPGKLAHVVKVRKNGYTKELMFDVSTSLLEVAGEYENPWGATDKMKKFDRYRPVDGVMFPHRVENWRSNRIVSETEVLEVKFNAPVPDDLFALPSSLASGGRPVSAP